MLVMMMMGALGVLPAACAGKAATRTPATMNATTSAVPVPGVALTGVIVNGVNARPLAGAIIDLDGRSRGESGPGGRFKIEDAPLGTHLLATRVANFRPRVQPVSIVLPEHQDAEDARPNDFIVLLFPPSAYFDEFPSLGTAPTCRTDQDCPVRQLCLMNNFKEIDAPTCAVPRICKTETDCKLGQQCEPVALPSGKELRVCRGQPAPEVTP